jgi:hypothetical protein
MESDDDRWKALRADVDELGRDVARVAESMRDVEAAIAKAEASAREEAEMRAAHAAACAKRNYPEIPDSCSTEEADQRWFTARRETTGRGPRVLLVRRGQQPRADDLLGADHGSEYTLSTEDARALADEIYVALGLTRQAALEEALAQAEYWRKQADGWMGRAIGEAVDGADACDALRKDLAAARGCTHPECDCEDLGSCEANGLTPEAIDAAIAEGRELSRRYNATSRGMRSVEPIRCTPEFCNVPGCEHGR